MSIISIKKKHNSLHWVTITFFKCFYCLLFITFSKFHNNLYIFKLSSILPIIIFFCFFLINTNICWFKISLSIWLMIKIDPFKHFTVALIVTSPIIHKIIINHYNRYQKINYSILYIRISL